MGWLKSIGGFFVDLPDMLYGNRLHEGWFGVAGAIYITAVGLAFLICGYACIHQWVKAADIWFKKETLEQFNLNRPADTAPRKIDWEQARRQQVWSWRFAIPYGLLVYTALYVWFREFYTWKSFFLFAAGVTAMAFFIRLWWVAVVTWSERKLYAKEPQAASKVIYGGRIPFGQPSNVVAGGVYLYQMSVPQAMSHYMSWGLQKSTKRRPPFIGLFRIFNPFIRLFRLRWLQPRLLVPAGICIFYGLLWTFTQVVAVFYLYHELNPDNRKKPLKPEWASDNAIEPVIGDTGAIPDTPGDAAAATGK